MVEKPFTYEINETLGILSQYGNETLEANIITYNNGKPKLDIRKWDRSGETAKMFKGITLNDDEAGKLLSILQAKYKPIKI